MIFLSDGECSVPDTAIQDLCRSAVRLGCVFSLCPSTSLTGPSSEENRYLFILSPLAEILRHLPSAGWPIWPSESRIMLLATLGRPHQFLPLSLLLSTR
jgi:hypothetical protein